MEVGIMKSRADKFASQVDDLGLRADVSSKVPLGANSNDLPVRDGERRNGLMFISSGEDHAILQHHICPGGFKRTLPGFRCTLMGTSRTKNGHQYGDGEHDTVGPPAR
jgi:hypothetical protein